MKNPGFVHLRLRSEYSISDSIVRIDEAVKAAVADGQPALALTDSANLFGWVKFYKAALAQGVQPICGIDSWVTNRDDRDRPYRLLLLAADARGYRNLCELGGFDVSGPVTVADIMARVGAGEYRVSAYGFEPRGLRWEVFVRLGEEAS